MRQKQQRNDGNTNIHREDVYSTDHSRYCADNVCYLNIYSTKESYNEVEYIRKDAFIEKAYDWIEDNILSSNQQDKSRLYFEQFKTYMKGE